MELPKSIVWETANAEEHLRTDENKMEDGGLNERCNVWHKMNTAHFPECTTVKHEGDSIILFFSRDSEGKTFEFKIQFTFGQSPDFNGIENPRQDLKTAVHKCSLLI